MSTASTDPQGVASTVILVAVGATLGVALASHLLLAESVRTTAVNAVASGVATAAITAVAESLLRRRA